MNSIDRDRKFREAQDALVHTIRTVVRTQGADPLTMTFILVHKTSCELYQAVVARGGTPTIDGYAISVGDREVSASDPLWRIAPDEIACMISIDDYHKALGLPLDALGITAGGEA